MKPLPPDIATTHTKYRAPVVDVFEYEGKDDDGAELRVKLSQRFLARTAENMNKKWEEKDYLCPIVIGHTVKGAKEVDQPPKVGVLHNYEIAPFGKDNTPTLWADHWIQNETTVPLNGVPMKLSHDEIASRFPHRSGEIWLGLCEVHPHSLLGATAPHRTLGLLKLSADGEGCVGYASPGDMKMADEKKPEADTGKAVSQDAKLDQVLGMLGQLLETFQAALGGQAGAAAGGHEPSGHDAEMEKFLASLDEGGGEGGGGEEKPKEKEGEYAKGKDDEKVKLERERDEAVLKLKRNTIKAKLTELRDKYLVDIDPEDEGVITDHMILPDDAFERTVARLQRNGKGRPPGDGATGLNAAVQSQAGDQAKQPAGGGRKVTTPEDKQKVVKLALKKSIDYASAAKELGFEIQ